jgi:hypothetical protein
MARPIARSSSGTGYSPRPDEVLNVKLVVLMNSTLLYVYRVDSMTVSESRPHRRP